MDSKTFINRLAQTSEIEEQQVTKLNDAFATLLRSCATNMAVVAIPSFGSFVPTKTDEEIITDRSTGRRLLLPPQITVEFYPAAKLRKSVMPQANTQGIVNEVSAMEVINLPKLISQLSEIADCNPAITRKYLHEFFALIENNLIDDEPIEIDGIGEFVKTDNPANPIKFLADKVLAETANEPFAAFEAIEISEDLKDEELFGSPNKEEFIETPPMIQPEIKPEITPDPQTIGEPIEEKIETIVDEIPTSEPELSEKIEEITEEVIDTDNIQEVNSEEEYTYEEPVEVENKTNSSLYLIIGLLIGLILGLVGGFFAGRMMGHFNDVEEIKSKTELLVSTDSIVANEKSLPDSANVAETSTAPKAEPVYDVVKNKRYLTTMAREHYGNYKYWVFIYKANPNLGNPNQISIGTKILIPDKESFMENSEEKTLEKAQNILNEINKKYKM